MYALLVTLLILDSLILMTAILLQSGKGGGLAASFGGASSSSDSFVGTRQAANLLTKLSWWGGAVFLALSLLLSILGTRGTAQRSVLEPLSRQQQAAPTAPAPTSGGATNPAVPLQPAVPSTAPSTTPAPQGQSAPPSKKP